jgi:hypothetical protein
MLSSPDNRLTRTGVAAMCKPVLTIARGLFVAGAASVLGVAMLAAPAAAKPLCASSAGKCFAVTVSPSTAPGPAAGGSVFFTFNVTNEAPTQQIGSFQITAPAPFVVTDASVQSSPGTVSHTSSSALFTNLSVAPAGGSITVTVTALLPCSGNSYQWGMQVKQSNDFSGLPGNNFQIASASAGNLAGTPFGSCKLAFTSDGQPTGTVVSTAVSTAVITSGFGSSGGPVKVAVLDASGQPIANPAAIGPVAVTVASPHNPNAPGNLLGTTTEQANGGVASFSDLSIDQSGDGYRLTATATATAGQVISASDPSDFFTIFGSLKKCQASGAPCSASSSSATTTGTVTTSSVTSPGPLLGAGIGGASYSCATYQSFSDPFSFDLYSGGVAQPGAQFSASLDVSKSTVKSSGRNQLADWQLCYASPNDFMANAVPGTYTPGGAMIGGVSFNTGLLLDCSVAPGGAPPCVQSRAKVNGDVIITFLASGDPVGRG